MTPKEMWGAEKCGVCGEHLTIYDTDVAEMVDLETGKHLIVHYMCGQGKDMELA